MINWENVDCHDLHDARRSPTGAQPFMTFSLRSRRALATLAAATI
jgi:hypothetical protein